MGGGGCRLGGGGYRLGGGECRLGDGECRLGGGECRLGGGGCRLAGGNGSLDGGDGLAVTFIYTRDKYRPSKFRIIYANLVMLQKYLLFHNRDPQNFHLLCIIALWQIFVLTTKAHSFV